VPSEEKLCKTEQSHYLGGIYMKIFWENLGAHIVCINNADNWHLFCELDEHEDATISLEVNGQTHQVCWSNEYIQGREHLGLGSYHVIEFYSAVVKLVFDRVKNDSPAYLDIDQIKAEVLPPFWRGWKEIGLVDDDLD
jgi:hypothetical protein